MFLCEMARCAALYFRWGTCRFRAEPFLLHWFSPWVSDTGERYRFRGPTGAL